MQHRLGRPLDARRTFRVNSNLKKASAGSTDSDAPWMLGAAGTTRSVWATVRGCLVLGMLKPTSKSSRLLKLTGEIEQVQQAHPEAQIEVESGDERRIELKPILRRVWARKGKPVKALVAQRYQWMDVRSLPASVNWRETLR